MAKKHEAESDVIVAKTENGSVETASSPPSIPAEQAKVNLPTVGRIVLYTEGRETLPAIVTKVDGEKVSLTVFESKGTRYVDDVPSVGEAKASHWHWPQRS